MNWNLVRKRLKLPVEINQEKRERLASLVNCIPDAELDDYLTENKTKLRAACDFCETPAWCVHRLLEHLRWGDWYFNCSWLEPSAGEGAIVWAVNSFCDLNKLTHPNWECWDLVEVPGVGQRDFLSSITDKPVDVIITNPPFSLAVEFAEHALSFEPSIAVCLLLRLGFLASAKRHAFLSKNMPSKVLVLPNRPSFTGGGTDNSEYAWFVWLTDHRRGKRAAELGLLSLTPKKERL